MGTIKEKTNINNFKFILTKNLFLKFIMFMIFFFILN